MGNYVTVSPNSGRLQKVLTIGIPVEKFSVSVQSLMGVGRLKAVFSDSEAPRSGEPQAHASVLYQEKFVNHSSEKLW